MLFAASFLRSRWTLKRKAWLGRITNGLDYSAVTVTSRPTLRSRGLSTGSCTSRLPTRIYRGRGQRSRSALPPRTGSYGELLAPRHRVEQRAEDDRRADAAQRIEDA